MALGANDGGSTALGTHPVSMAQGRMNIGLNMVDALRLAMSPRNALAHARRYD
jgi:hypothetical protein